MKTAISIPDELFRRADAFAKRSGKSRSELYTDALRDHLSRQDDSSITARLNEVYADGELSSEERDWVNGVASGLAARETW